MVEASWVDLDDFRGLFQPQPSYDSMSPYSGSGLGLALMTFRGLSNLKSPTTGAGGANMLCSELAQ